jgi:hypothetical protein
MRRRIVSERASWSGALTVSAPDHDALSETILRRIHSMPGVVSTRSYMILEERAGTAPELSTDAWQL